MAERVARSGAHIYGQAIAFAVGGGLFWILMAALLGPQQMGKAAYAVSLASLASTVALLGLDRAVMKEYPRNPSSLYAAASIYALVGGASSAAAAYAAYRELGAVGAAATAALALAQVSPIFTAALIASYRTERLPIYAASSIAARFAVALALIKSGWAAVALGYAAGSLVYLALTAYAAHTGRPPSAEKKLALVKAGLSAWPSQVVGAVLMGGGAALTYSSAGQEAAGIYYVAYTVASIAVGLPAAIATAALPYFASNNSKPETLAGITAYVGSPFVAAAAAAPSAVLALLGREYARGGAQLALLSVALWLIAVASVYLNKTYAEGRYLRYATAYVAFGLALAATSLVADYSAAALAGAAVLYAASGADPRLLARLAPAAPAPLLGLLLPWPAAVAAAFLFALAGASLLAPKGEREVVATLAPRPIRPLVEKLILV